MPPGIIAVARNEQTEARGRVATGGGCDPEAYDHAGLWPDAVPAEVLPTTDNTMIAVGIPLRGAHRRWVVRRLSTRHYGIRQVSPDVRSAAISPTPRS